MAGIDTLFKGAVGSLAKDKITNTLTPTQMELASFILNPQYYIAEKGVNKIAEILGYGSDYKNLSADEKSDKAYYKEIMRNTVGDMLPESLGDIVRATPRETEPYDPYNGYYSQDINDWVSTRNSMPEDVDNFANVARDMSFGTQTPGVGKTAGPAAEDSAIFESAVSNLPYELKSTPTSGAPDDFDPALLAAIIRGDSSNTVDNSVTDDMGNITITDTKNTNTPGGDFVNTRSISTPITESVAPTGYTFDSNIGAVVPAASTESLAPVNSVYDASIGANTPITESLAPVGSTYDPNLGMNVPATATPSMPDYSRAYSALGGAEIVNNLRDQFLNMGLDENTIGSVFSKYYAPEAGNEGIKSIFSEAAYRNGGFLNRGGR